MTLTYQQLTDYDQLLSPPPKIVQLAEKFGHIVPGWTLQDYIVHAAKVGGYETVLIHGVQFSGKSTRALQMGYWVYGDWETVLKNIIFKPAKFVEKLDSVPTGERIPCLIFDDIGVHFPSTTFRTDIRQYEAIDQVWTAIRTKCNVVICTIPLIDRLAKNIKDNVTFEVYLGRNQLELIERLVRLPGIRQVETNFFKIAIEKPAPFNLYEVPLEIFQRYYNQRQRLAEEAINSLKGTVEMEEVEGYINVLDAATKAREMRIKLSPATIQQNISRGVLDGRRIKGKLHVNEEEFMQYLETKKRIKKTP